MNCLDCHPHTTPAVAICGRCGAGLCAEHIIEGEEHLTFTAPINRVVEVSPPARHLRCDRCAAAECAQAQRKPYDEADEPARQETPAAPHASRHRVTRATSLRRLAGRRARR